MICYTIPAFYCVKPYRLQIYNARYHYNLQPFQSDYSRIVAHNKPYVILFERIKGNYVIIGCLR